MSEPSPTLADLSQQLDLFMPLQFFYLQQNRPLPDIKMIEGAKMPEPQRHLLVHSSDMTPRLRAFHQSDIGLKVVHVQKSEDYVMRLVVLYSKDTGKPVEFGAIGIQLDGLDELTRNQIRDGIAPLGGILEAREILHTSEPKGYFRVAADEFIAELLHEPVGTAHYGRCNALCHPGGIVFADIVEILPSS